MKKYLLLIVLFCLCVHAFAQYGALGVYSSATSSTMVVEKGEIRDVAGGTVIIPIYQGSNFNPTIKNAFQHACRIWEEKIPTTYPLRIMVRMAHLIDNNALATVTPTYIQNLEDEYIEQAFAKRRTQIGWEGYYTNYVSQPDAIITFNSSQPFDYNENPNNVNANKYDFITVAIQAIARAIGFNMTSLYDGTNIVKIEPTSSLTKYIFGSNSSFVYQNIVNNGGKSISYAGRNWPLYCPSTYNMKYSLSYFAPDSTNLETIFMQPGIPKGTAIRYIGDSVDDLFEVFSWSYSNIATGSSDCQVNPANTNEVIPYVGNTSSVNTPNLRTRSRNENNNIEDSLSWMASRREDQGAGYYVLHNDGTWEQFQSLQSLSAANQDYARTSDGYLRLMYITTGYDYLYHRTYDIIYHELYKFPPQMPEFGLNGYVVSDITGLNNSMRYIRRPSAIMSREEDEYIDVEIGFEKTEGCKQVLVEQTDSDWPIPYTYFVEPSEGAFTAYMTKQYPSTIKLTYINDEGQAVSQPQVFDFTSEISSSQQSFSLKQRGTMLYYELKDSLIGTNSTASAPNMNYRMLKADNGSTILKGNMSKQIGYIDISPLPKGIYNLIITANGKTFSRKWAKK